MNKKACSKHGVKLMHEGVCMGAHAFPIEYVEPSSGHKTIKLGPREWLNLREVFDMLWKNADPRSGMSREDQQVALLEAYIKYYTNSTLCSKCSVPLDDGNGCHMAEHPYREQADKCPECGSTSKVVEGKPEIYECGSCYHTWTKAEQQAEVEELRKALRLFGNHLEWCETSKNYKRDCTCGLDAALAASPSTKPMSAIDFWETLPHCVGYPTCDGDLEGESHEVSCPLFGRKELTLEQFAEAYATYRTTGIRN